VVRAFFSKTSKFKTEFLTEEGLRDNNEDNYAVEKLAIDTYFLAVADGMGGKAGGEIASQIALTSVVEYLRNEFKKKDGNKKLREYLEKAFLVAQTAVSDKIVSTPELKGMGTTLTALLLSEGKYVWGNIGDSRMYLMSDGRMKLVTEDHSYIQDFFRNHNKELPPTVLAQYSNIVTKIIDGGTDKPDIFPSRDDSAIMKEGDFFLLCSDGLITDKIKDQSRYLEEIIVKSKELRKIAQKLVDSALENGSDDNITVVLGLYGELITKPPDDDFKTIRIVIDPKPQTG